MNVVRRLRTLSRLRLFIGVRTGGRKLPVVVRLRVDPRLTRGIIIAAAMLSGAILAAADASPRVHGVSFTGTALLALGAAFGARSLLRGE